MEKQIADEEDSWRKATRDAGSAEGQLAALREMAGDLGEKKDTLEADIAGLNLKVRELQENIPAKKQEYNAILKEVEKASAYLVSLGSIEEVNKELDTAKASRTQVQQQVRAEQEEYMKVSKDVATVKAELAELEGRIVDLKREQNDLKMSVEEIAPRTKGLQALNESIAAKAEEYEIIQKQIERARTDLASLLKTLHAVVKDGPENEAADEPPAADQTEAD